MEGLIKEKWIIDTDPGCDDMMCLIYMLNRKDIEILMISLVEGNTTMENVNKNIRKILKITKKIEIPFYNGCSPIIKGCPNAIHVHMVDGLGDVEELINLEIKDVPPLSGNSCMKIVELIELYPYQINLLMIGPLTNLSIAYMLNPKIANLIKSIYLMGGSINSKGNLLPSSEFNFSYDFIAPKIVLNNFKNIIIVPWDATEQNKISLQQFTRIKHDILSKQKDFNELCFLYAEKLFNKVARIKGYMIMNDLYCSLCVFNSKIVDKCFLAKCDSIIDSEDIRGCLTIKSKKYIKSFEIGLCNLLQYNEPGLQLVIESFNNEIILQELIDNTFL